MTFSWTSGEGHFGAVKITTLAIWTAFAHSRATRKSDLVELFTILAQNQFLHSIFRKRHSLVFPREKYNPQRKSTPCFFRFSSSTTYSNARLNFSYFVITAKVGKSISCSKRPRLRPPPGATEAYRGHQGGPLFDTVIMYDSAILSESVVAGTIAEATKMTKIDLVQ